VLDAGPGLRIVANIAVGFDNIDLAAARSRGVIVTNTPDVLTEATADFTWGLILAVTRRIAEGERTLRRGGWSGWALDFMLDPTCAASNSASSVSAVSAAPWPPAPERSACGSHSRRPTWTRMHRGRRIQPGRASAWTNCCRVPTWCRSMCR